jgi:uncharacterized flavoprotein (TIGR03862 family)
LEDVGALVVGAGPAGLAAAEVLAQAGARVTLAEAKPSIGRKLLMAGKSGLNLTKDEPFDDFVAGYPEGAAWLGPILAEFGPREVMDWARGLGVEVFAGSSGRVFPRGMKASPLLRAWVARLAALGVETRTRWRWRGWADGAATFETPEGPARVRAGACVLALGGGSWARLGSDGAWRGILAAEGVASAPFRPSNVGFVVAWSPAMARHFGAAVKPVRLGAGGRSVEAEFVVSARRRRGGRHLCAGAELRAGAALTLDLAPARSLEDVAARLARHRRGASLGNHTAQDSGAEPGQDRLAAGGRGGGAGGGGATARAVKGQVLPLSGPRPLDEAISTGPGGCRGRRSTRADAARTARGLRLRGDARLGRADGGIPADGLPRDGASRGRSAAAWLAR